MKRILFLLLFLISFSASAQFVPAQINYGNYNVYGSVWINKLLRLQIFKDTAKSDTLILVVNHATGQVDTMNFAELASIIGGSTASKWAYNGTTLHPIDTSKHVAIGTNDAKGYGFYNDGSLNSSIGKYSIILDTSYLATKTSSLLRINGSISSGTWDSYSVGINESAGTTPFSTIGFTKRISKILVRKNYFEVDTGKIWFYHQKNGRESSVILNDTGFIVKIPSKNIISADTGGNHINFYCDVIRFKNFAFPTSDGSPGQTLITDGSGTLTWGTISGGSSYFDSTNTVIHLKDSTNKFSIGTKHLAGTEKFRVYNGAVLFDGTTGATPVSGAGTRFMWIGSKKAIRFGAVTGNYWDAANIGDYSIAGGSDCKAGGSFATAFGQLNNSAGDNSFTANGSNDATGYMSTAFGNQNLSGSYYTFVSGKQNNVTGYFGFGANYLITQQSYCGSAFGTYNNATGTTSSWVSTDPLFQIGNGTGTGANSNDAFRLNKDGSGWIGDATPAGNPLITWNTTANTITIDSLITKSGERALADEASLAAPTSIIGGGTVYVCSATAVVAFAHFNYNSDGSVTLESNSANVVNTDSDTYFCIYDAGSGFAFKNRLGAKYQIKYTLIY